MKSLDFIFVGQAKNPAYARLEDFYRERITHYLKSCHVHFVKDAQHKNIEERNRKEAADILAQLSDKDVLIVCDEKGRALNSRQFADKLDAWSGMGQRVVFVVGGAYGLTDEIRARARFVLKLTEWTLPHELARVVLMEQVYRGYSILKGEKYHHA